MSLVCSTVQQEADSAAIDVESGKKRFYTNTGRFTAANTQTPLLLCFCVKLQDLKSLLLKQGFKKQRSSLELMSLYETPMTPIKRGILGTACEGDHQLSMCETITALLTLLQP